MKFTVDVVSNCDPTNLLITIPHVKMLVAEQNRQTNKQIMSLFFCVCCCVNNPNNSVLLLHPDRLGIPPKRLIPAKNSGYHVISYVGKNTRQVEEKIPLIFCTNANLAKIVLNELDQIYIKSSRLNAVFDGLDLNELDAQAAIWNQLFGLPAKSRGTQQLETYATDDVFQTRYEEAFMNLSKPGLVC